ncbi:DoxX-like family protein [Adhaeribacter sp. BT258]|uniref:DoxX-like family protein n=1 Tax=Adhaeribacter terrigena TaxID=2793070 RepID=A0ABS1C1G4_9BACT|nr:DoxX-like family protein [Adhaeribacter terrigena]MBK0403249.1 DoxX-like family protein [Adhaeribacter terrigena]
MKRDPIYVETFMHTSLERVWEFTQTPEIHQEWDLRFNRIEYLPKETEDAPQHFLYETQIGFGIKVSGKGKSTGTHSKETGESTSALKFWSDEPISLIKTGSGYWKYIPENNGVKFLTWYDYQTRHGFFGNLIDKFLFRPLIGWATAWSFDALKMWLERGQHPRLSKKLLFVLILSNFLIALTWLYHGIVPKLMYMETGELEMLTASGMFTGYEKEGVYAAGIAEIFFGIAFLFFGRWRLLHYLNIFSLLILGGIALVAKHEVYLAPFNPATTSFGVIGLSVIVLSLLKFTPSAANCKRKPDRN